MANKIWEKIIGYWRALSSKCSDQSLSASEYARTTAAKRKAKRKGKQFSKQPKSIAAKVRRYRQFS